MKQTQRNRLIGPEYNQLLQSQLGPRPKLVFEGRLIIEGRAVPYRRYASPTADDPHEGINRIAQHAIHAGGAQ